MPSLSITIQAAVALAEQIRREIIPAPRPLALAGFGDWLPDWLDDGSATPNGSDHGRRGWGKDYM